MPRVRSCIAASVALAALITTAQRADAQGTDAPRSRVGAYLGASSATISEVTDLVVDGTDPAIERSRRTGLQVGFWLNKPLRGALSLQPELHYTQKGARYAAAFADGGDFGFPTSAEISLNLAYLELPVLVRADLGRARATTRPFLVAGPMLAYRMGCTVGIDAAIFSFTSDCDETDETGESLNLASFDVGGTVGGGLAVRRGARDYVASVRYTHGVRSLSSEQDGVTNRNVSILFGISF